MHRRLLYLDNKKGRLFCLIVRKSVHVEWSKSLADVIETLHVDTPIVGVINPAVIIRLGVLVSLDPLWNKFYVVHYAMLKYVYGDIL